MSIDIHALGIDQLSVPDRLTLIEQIWETLPEQVEPSDVPEWHRQELEKRLAQAEAFPGVGKPWRDVVGRLESVIQRHGNRGFDAGSEPMASPHSFG